MRMIDADALLKLLKEQRFKYDTSEDCITVEQATETCCELIPYLIVGMIEEMPTVDAVPVRHGKWLDITDSHIGTCSLCGDRWGSVDMMNYCPSCGARMVEDE